ncbi:sugar phosphate nucleotidyltransferase [Rickettsiella endosymbiont of Dermanyssus gallinae]|uniref:sugar phosphate nucleotidyltransferase n=1 Tax=Rickettsiella endosymbiont of Dermanyssus gallinae TaxID=2856608 RepID=UPI001C5311CC|nr:sugar phosphate nucleotidyltransferase [Rickettsiella endosymbiont of Dermanyssus gallinae]
MKDLFPIAILAGGMATRMRPLTEKLPKSLLLVKGEPFIAHQLRLLKNEGFKEIILCIGHLGRLIQAYVQDGKQFDLVVRYAWDGNHLLGTAGAIKQALPLLGENFFVMYGDSYLMIDYKRIQQSFLQQNKPALMTIYKNNNQGDKSNIEFKSKKIIDYNKKITTARMKYIDYGLGLFNSVVFNPISERKSFDLADLYKTLLLQEKLAAFEVYNRFYEIGSMQGLADMAHYLTHQEVFFE